MTEEAAKKIDSMADKFMAVLNAEVKLKESPTLCLTGMLLSLKGLLDTMPPDPPPTLRILTHCVNVCLKDLIDNIDWEGPEKTRE